MAVYIGKDQPSGWVIKHYGVKGMKWGKRKIYTPGQDSKEQQRQRIEERTQQLLKSKDFMDSLPHNRKKAIGGKRNTGKTAAERTSFNMREKMEDTYYRNALDKRKTDDPNYRNPIQYRNRDRFIQELDEDGAFDRYKKKVKGRDGVEKSRRSKLAESAASDTYDKITRSIDKNMAGKRKTKKRK